jgi:uncharacterized protein
VKFICDAMLGKLARYLRILGLNSIYIRSQGMLDSFRNQNEPVIFLTRNRKSRWDGQSVLIQSDYPLEQVKEIRSIIRPFVKPEQVMGRCIACNVELSKASKQDIEQYVPEFVFHNYESFKRCPSCGKVYWEGSHAVNMAKYAEEVLKDG